MKKILLLATLLTSSLFADLTWHKYSEAIALAKAEDKIVMVMLSREDCPSCEYMKDIVFEDAKIMEMMEKKFLAVQIDIHKDYIPNSLTYIGTPTFHFLNKYESKIDRIDGGENVKTFMDKLEELVSKK